MSLVTDPLDQIMMMIYPLNAQHPLKAEHPPNRWKILSLSR